MRHAALITPRLPGQALPLLVFALLALAAKLLTIAAWGVATPLRDQWDEEAADLYVPLLDHTLRWSDLLASHGEHRMALTRLLDLLLLTGNGLVWQPLLQLVVGALLHVLALVVLLRFLGRVAASFHNSLLLVAATLLCCLPFNAENTLWGFQSQIYLALLFSFIFLWGLCTAPLFSWRWWLGLACGGLAYLSFAAGAVTLGAGAVLLLVQMIRGVAGGRGHYLVLALLSVLTVMAVVDIHASPTLTDISMGPGGTQLAAVPTVASSMPQFLAAFARALSWPLPLPLLLVHLPLLAFMWRQLRWAPPAADGSWFVFAMGVWALAQMVVISYGRASDPLQSRYTDFYAIALLLDFFCLSMWPAADTPARRGWRGVWLVLVLCGLLWQALSVGLMYGRVVVPAERVAQEHIRSCLHDGNAALLQEDAGTALPVVAGANELKTFLGSPEVRYVLPPELMPAHAARQPGWVTGLVANLHTLGLLLLTLGLALGLWLWMRSGHAGDTAS